MSLALGRRRLKRKDHSDHRDTHEDKPARTSGSPLWTRGLQLGRRPLEGPCGQEQLLYLEDKSLDSLG